jgi:hypothetical protein
MMMRVFLLEIKGKFRIIRINMALPHIRDYRRLEVRPLCEECLPGNILQPGVSLYFLQSLVTPHWVFLHEPT